MAIASQYVRGRAARPTLTGYPYYMLIDGDTLMTAVKAGPMPTFTVEPNVRNDGVLSIVTSPVYAGERAIKFDSSAAHNAAAWLSVILYRFDAAYPFRIGVKAYVTSITILWYGLSFAAVRLGANHICGVGKWFSPERFFEADYAEGLTRIPTNIVPDTWHIIDMIEVNDTQYYVEIDGVKYGPILKRSTGKSDRTSSIGDWSELANTNQLILVLDEFKIYRVEETYDPTGAIPVANVYSFWDDFETESGLKPFTITTAGGGTVTRSTTMPYEGLYSLEVNTLGALTAVAYATLTPPVGLSGNLNYPIYHEFFWRYEESPAATKDMMILSLFKDATLLGELNANYTTGPPARLRLNVCDAAGWNMDVKTINFATWYKICLKELSDTEFQLYVDDVLTPAGKTFTKAASGKCNKWDRIGDIWTTHGQGRAYWDNFRWYRTT